MVKLYIRILFWFFCNTIFAQRIIKFNHLTIDHGLSHNNVRQILQDKRGFLWLATDNGLNRYDGYSFIVYQHDFTDSTSISDNLVTSLYEDEEGLIWVGTATGGLNIFHPTLNRFSRLAMNYKLNNQEYEANFVKSITGNKKGDIFIGTTSGLFVYNKQERKLSYFNPGNEASASGAATYAISYVDDELIWIGAGSDLCHYNHSKGEMSLFPGFSADGYPIEAISSVDRDRVWVGTRGNGLYRIDLGQTTPAQIIHYVHDNTNASSLSSNQVNGIFVETGEKIWIATSNGLNLFLDQSNKHFQHYKHDENNPESLNSDEINFVLVGEQNILWVGIYGGGLNFFDKNRLKFEHVKHERNNPNSLVGNMVNTFFEDDSGNLWIGTLNRGLSIFDKKKNKYSNYTHDPSSGNTINSQRISSIIKDSKQNYWIATPNGLNLFNPEKGNFEQYPAAKIQAQYIDSKNNLWLCTQNGLGLFNYKKGEIEYFNKSNSNLNASYSTSMVEDKHQNFWIGEYGRLLYYKTKEDTTFVYEPNKEYPDSGISHSYVISLLYDSKERLWIGTSGGGLNLYHPETNTFSHYHQSDGLPSDVICAMLEDDNNNLWISTINGLSKFNPETETFKNYTPSEGLQSKGFLMRSALKLRNGEMVFGGINGFNIFHPDSVKDDPMLPRVIITDFKLFDKSVKVKSGRNTKAEDFLLDQHISFTKKLNLSYKQNFLSFEYVAVNFSLPEKNQYMYKMEGFDNEWRQVKNKREASYTNIPPGKYTFRVKASNSDAAWSEEETSIDITITPPYYVTWWFRSLILFFVIAVSLTFYFLRMRQMRMRQKLLEAKVRDRTQELNEANTQLEEKQEEIILQNEKIKEQNDDLLASEEELKSLNEELNTNNEMLSLQKDELSSALSELKETQEQLIQSEKMASIGILASGISHELNNPLNFIQSGLYALDDFIAENTKDKGDEYKPLMRNIETGINRASKIIQNINEFSRMSLKDNQVCDIHNIIDSCLLMLQNEIKNKIEIEKKYTNVPYKLFGNEGKLNQVFLNILTNSCQAIEKTGTINISTKIEDDLLLIIIEDSGLGISKENIKKVMDPFFTTKDPGKGTGMGMSIAYMIVQEHKGEIKYESLEGKGTEVTVTLPIEE